MIPGRLQHASGIVARVVLGRHKLSSTQLETLQLEEEHHGPIMWLPVQVQADQMSRLEGLLNCNPPYLMLVSFLQCIVPLPGL